MTLSSRLHTPQRRGTVRKKSEVKNCQSAQLLGREDDQEKRTEKRDNSEIRCSLFTWYTQKSQFNLLPKVYEVILSSSSLCVVSSLKKMDTIKHSYQCRQKLQMKQRGAVHLNYSQRISKGFLAETDYTQASQKKQATVLQDTTFSGTQFLLLLHGCKEHLYKVSWLW